MYAGVRASATAPKAHGKPAQLHISVIPVLQRQENPLQVLKPIAKTRDPFSSKVEVGDLRLSSDLNTCAIVYTQ